MRKFIAAALLFTGFSAQAEIITCQFTEPFVTVTYTTGTRVMKIVDNGMGTTEVLNKVGMIFTGLSTFELRSRTGETLMVINMDNNGSDGMSDFNFPLSAEYKPLNLFGGCETLKLKKVCSPEGGC